MLDEMQIAGVSSQIEGLAKSINQNLVGQATIEAEFWADTLDRWAEQLVDPLGEHPPVEHKLIELPNLPPEIIVEVMRIINREMQLREETREFDQARKAIDTDVYRQNADGLRQTQQELTQKSLELAEEIQDLPNSKEKLIQHQFFIAICSVNVDNHQY